MSDRIVVMNKGRIDQVGTPKDIYYAPKTAFVARFFGDNNILDATIRDGRAETPIGVIPVAPGAVPGRALVAVRPERIALEPVPGAIAVPATVHDAIFVGAAMHLRLKPDAAASQMLLVKLPSDRAALAIAPGTAVTAAIRPDDVAVVRAEGEGAP